MHLNFKVQVQKKDINEKKNNLTMKKIKAGDKL